MYALKVVILVFFMVISVNRRLFRYFGSYSGISVIPVILVNRRTRSGTIQVKITSLVYCFLNSVFITIFTLLSSQI